MLSGSASGGECTPKKLYFAIRPQSSRFAHARSSSQISGGRVQSHSDRVRSPMDCCFAPSASFSAHTQEVMLCEAAEGLTLQPSDNASGFTVCACAV